MSHKERHRYHPLEMLEGGTTTWKEATTRMKVSYQQIKRLKRKLINEGAKGLVNGSRGRPSPKSLSRELAEKISELSLTTYDTFNDAHFNENLRETEGSTVSRGTLRRLARANPRPQ